MSTTRRRGATVLALSGLLGATALTGATAGTASAADELPVYAVRSEGLSQEQAAALQRAFGLKTVERTPEGVVTFTDEDRHLRVPGIDRGAGQPDESGQATNQTQLDLTGIRGLRAVPLADAAKRVGEALRGIGLLPAEAVASASHTTLDITDANGNPVVSAPLDTTVAYAFALGGVPLEGPGSKVRVSLDGTGAVTQLTYAARTVAADGAKPVLPLDDGRKKCADALAGTPLGPVGYAYPSGPLGAGTTRLEPFFRCQGADSGESAPVLYLPAVVGSTDPAPDPTVPPRQRAAGDAGVAGDVGAQWTTRVDVGSSGTGTCQSLPGIPADITGFNTRFTNAGIPVQFSWTGANAWEQDFKDPAFAGGQDHVYADDVDMTYYHGRGGAFGLSFAGCSAVTDSTLRNTEARWGNRDSEWMSLYTPSLLQTTASGQAWWQRWGPSFRGLHQINSFETGVVQNSSFGSRYGNYLLRRPFLNFLRPMKVRVAWAQASIDTQPSWVRWSTMGPIGNSWIANFDDYFWGKGPVGPDTLPTVGFWKISGSS
ncbi:DUF6345 domain-containing protein [Saccharothrix longispora]|uniref:DUF6345 domain-containing protein n=1 Tax=Saccharothrix longispora TaxID=33920 RepID=UPI0028FDB1DA|nr:DUF6345 domain-containing protein [Saccharothrix longispora]MDU0291270.1 DUF6345 domain-containing protein [Saccharothrix longispora]